MNADEFVKLARTGDAKFRVTKVILHAEGQKFRCQGSLLVGKRDFELNLEVDLKHQTPEPKRVVWTPADAWKVSGTIEGDLKFSCDQVSPLGKEHFWSFGERKPYIQKLSLESIDLIPSGFDALSPVQKAKLLGRPIPKKPKYPDVEFHAMLFGCKPVFLNAGTRTEIKNDFLGNFRGGSSFDTFIDRNNDYDFALIKKDGDTHIHFRSKSQFHSVSAADDWRRFYALLFAIGFTHGFQPWPYRILHYRDGRKIADKITVPRKLAKTIHAPFDDGIGHLGNLGRKGSQNSVIRLAARFFEKKTPLSENLSHLLFLFREAGGSSAHFDIKTLALCSLFEGVVTLMFDELKLEDELRRTSSQFDEYLKLRDRLVKRLRRLASRNNRPSFERLAGSLNSAKEFRVKDKFKVVCEHFGLNYENEMEQHFEAWKKKRNPMMHGSWNSKTTDYSDQALIAGAINILVLKLIGYSGQMRCYAFAYEIKDRYKRI
jgi:hypothetical protein